MTKLTKITLSSICLLGVLCATTASAVDQAAAAGDLAKVSAVSVQAKAALTAAALGGDVDAIAQAQKIADAVDGAAAQAGAAYAALEAAVAAGDEDAAQAAANDVNAALQNAMDALNGVVAPPDFKPTRRDLNRNSGGGPGRPYDPPNMYNVPWNSQAMQDFYQSQFGNFWQAGNTPPESDATPE